MHLVIIASLALAHGGEDHGPPAGGAAAAPGGLRVPLSSQAVDAVLVVADSGGSTLLAADAETSAPLALTRADLNLAGPAPLVTSYQPGKSPGFLGTSDLLAAHGDYAGSLVTHGPDDILSVPAFRWGPAEVAHAAAASVVPWILGLGAVGVALVVAMIVGFLVGRRAAVASLFLVGLAGRVGAHGGEDHGAPAGAAVASGGPLALRMDSQFLVHLRTARVFAEPFRPSVLALGHITSAPGGAATLRAPVRGTLLSPPGGFPVPGRAIHAGDLLARIAEGNSAADRADVGAARAEAATRVAEARAALALAERDVAAIPSVGVSLSDRDRLELASRVDVARATLAEAEAQLAALDRGAAVTAPIAGRIVANHANPGDAVNEGDPLFRIVSEGALWAQVRVRATAGLDIVPGVATMVNAGGELVNALVLDGGREFDPATGTALVTLALDAAPGLRPGLSAEAWIPVGPARDTLVVPESAVVESSGVPVAFVKTGPESFEARELDLGGRGAGRVAVAQGLAPGERVVVAGAYTLKSVAGR